MENNDTVLKKVFLKTIDFIYKYLAIIIFALVFCTIVFTIYALQLPYDYDHISQLKLLWLGIGIIISLYYVFFIKN